MKKIKSKSNKQMKLWEKIFLTISIVSIIVISSIYMYRLVYYYQIEHPKKTDNTLAAHIIKKGTTSTGDGLYTFDSKNYYYQGKNVSNYVWYSGRLFRIINIDEQGLTLITENSQTSLVWGIENNIEESYIYNWLNNKEDTANTGIFLNSINNYKSNLVLNSWCVGETSLEKASCSSKIESYANLLSVSDYLKAGGANSYLNNSTYWWTSNISPNGKPWYIFNTGGINDEVSTNDTYYSYGVRPVIKVSRNLEYLKGSGTKEDPYQINIENIDNIQDKPIGEYIQYSNYIWRIASKEKDTVKLILDSNIKNKEENLLIKYNNIDNYLNKTFYNTLSKKHLKKCDFYKGTYNKDTKYDYQNIYTSKTNNYIGLPSIGELFINEYENTWLSNSYGSASLQYKTTEQNRIIADVNNNTNNLRPVICINNDIKILSGDGTQNSPYILEE